MESAPPPAQGGGAFPSSRSPPSPSHHSAPGGGEDDDEGTRSEAMVAGDGGKVEEKLVGCRDSPRSKISRKRKHKEYHMQVGEEELRGEKHTQAIVRNEPPRSKNIKSAKNKGGLPVGSISASPRVTSSPGVNILVKAATIRRASMVVNSGSTKRAKTAGSPGGSTSQQSLDSPLQQPPISPSLDDLSPVGRTTNSQGWTRRPRKLLSRIWKEVEPIYQGRKLVKGRCVHCQKVFPASRDSGSSHIGRHLKLWNIKKTLNKEELNQEMKVMNKEATSQDIIIARMIRQMQTKFNQYWKESYKSACIPVILDPRFKYDLLEYLLRDFGSEEEARTWMGVVKKTMEKLFDEYNVVVEDVEDEDVEDKDDPLAEWDKHMRSKRRQSSNEMDRYLREELIPRKEEVNILQWWKINSSKYPVLSKMARDILAIPASTVPSESAFSTGGRVVSDYRSSLSSSTVEILICLQD